MSIKSKIGFALAMASIAMGSDNSMLQTPIAATRSTEDIIEERRRKGIKPNIVSKPVKPWMGKVKLSKKKRKDRNAKNNKK